MNRKDWYMSSRISSLLIAILIVVMTIASVGQAAQPKNQALLGAATYITMPLRKLAHPILMYADAEALLKYGIHVDQVLEKFGYASPVDGESADVYSDAVKTAYVDGNGGIGLNENFGSGRAAIIDEEWQIKGSGRTAMVNPNADASHRNGASLLPEAIHEAIWGNLLAAELPYGAYRVVAIIATGSNVNGAEGGPRVLIVREDPLRPGHYVINPTLEQMNDSRDRVRVQEAMAHLVEALPQPTGATKYSETEKFRSGIFEFIDRQAIQHAYSWAHSLFHGGTSPTNAGFDGRMLDFGTFSAFDGYPKVRIIHDDGFMGETSVYKRDLLKDIRDSWVKTLSPQLLAVLPSEDVWFSRFERTFQKTRRTEMLRLAGAFSELKDELLEHPEGQKLAETLVQLAEAGNENEIEAWKGESPFRQGRYDLGKILVTASSLSLRSLNPENEQIKLLIPDDSARRNFVEEYVALFQLQKGLAQAHGIDTNAEAHYRKFASQIRNKKMQTIFRLNENEKNIWHLLEEYQKDRDPRPTQQYIDQVISENRRDFHDTDPYTIVLRETKLTDRAEREVYDARSNKIVKVHIQNEGFANVYAGRCESLFLKAR